MKWFVILTGMGIGALLCAPYLPGEQVVYVYTPMAVTSVSNQPSYAFDPNDMETNQFKKRVIKTSTVQSSLTIRELQVQIREQERRRALAAQRKAELQAELTEAARQLKIKVP